MTYYDYLCRLLEPMRIYRTERGTLSGAELYAAGAALDGEDGAMEYAEREGVLQTAEGEGLARREKLTVQDLLEEPFLLTERAMSYRRLMDEKLAERSLEISPVLECGNVQQLCRLVEAGAGLSFLPDYATESAVCAGKMARLDVGDFEVEIWKQLLHHRSKWLSPAVQTVMDFCAAC